MLILEMKRSAVAVFVASSRLQGRLRRLMRVRVLFPDLGRYPVVDEAGFLRYEGEPSMLLQQATVQERQLLAGLTNHL